MNRLGLLFLIGYLASGSVAHAATYYVSKAGNNANSCAAAQSISTPKLSINAGIGCLSAGDTLFVRAGDYDEGIGRMPSGTSWATKVRIANYPGETVWLRPLVHLVGNPGEAVRLQNDERYIEFDGINMDGRNVGYGVFDVISDGTNDPHHIRLQNAEIIARSTDNSALSEWAQWGVGVGGHSTSSIVGGHELINLTIHGGGRPGCTNDNRCNGYGIYVSGPNNLVERCNIYDTSAVGIVIYNGGGASADNNIVRNNHIHDITRTGHNGQVAGIQVSGNNNQIYNNIIDRVSAGDGGDGVFVYYGNGNRINNNTFYSNTKSGINLYTNASGTEVRNNISYAGGTADFVNGGSGTVQSNNLFGTNPLFVNPSANNFQLQATSPAIDAGARLTVVTTDFAGVARPQGGMPDIGAYEFGGQQDGSAPMPPSGLRIVER